MELDGVGLDTWGGSSRSFGGKGGAAENCAGRAGLDGPGLHGVVLRERDRLGLDWMESC